MEQEKSVEIKPLTTELMSINGKYWLRIAPTPDGKQGLVWYFATVTGWEVPEFAWNIEKIYQTEKAKIRNG